MKMKEIASKHRDSRAATLQDVADRAGVSRCTASSIINGSRSGTRTSAATRERVRQAALELSYRPNAVARSLRHQSTQTIGFYNGFGYIDARNPFLNDLIAGMHARCDYTDYDLLIHRVSDRGDKVRKFQELISGKVDGVVLWSPIEDPIVAMVAERGFPAVAIADSHPEIPSVTGDDLGGSILIAQRLSTQGHKRVLYRLPPAPRMSANRRYFAFAQEANRLGITVITGHAIDYTGALGVDEIALLTSSDDVRPTAIVCWCDQYALQAYHYLTMAPHVGGWSGKFALIGFDGFEYQGMPVRLTSYYVPWDEVASMAVDVVKQIINGEDVPRETFVPGRLIEGNTW
jgi:LacI family transcriptional regulator